MDKLHSLLIVQQTTEIATTLISKQLTLSNREDKMPNSGSSMLHERTNVSEDNSKHAVICTNIPKPPPFPVTGHVGTIPMPPPLPKSVPAVSAVKLCSPTSETTVSVKSKPKPIVLDYEWIPVTPELLKTVTLKPPSTKVRPKIEQRKKNNESCAERVTDKTVKNSVVDGYESACAESEPIESEQQMDTGNTVIKPESTVTWRDNDDLMNNCNGPKVSERIFNFIK